MSFNALTERSQTRRSAPIRLAALSVSLGLFLTACGGAAVSSDLPSIAFLSAVPGSDIQDVLLEHLADGGVVLGEDFEVLDQGRENHYPDADGATTAVRRWAGQGVDLIVALSSVGAGVAAREVPDATVVFLVNNPSAVGLVADEQRPEGRLTGVTFRVPADRTLAAARAAIPGLDRVGVLFPEDDPAAAPHRDAVLAAGDALGIGVRSASFVGEGDVKRAVRALAADEVDAVFVSNSPTAVRARGAIEAATKRSRLPVIANTDFVPYALVVLQPDVGLLTEQLARQTARLLRGAAPRNIPVEDPRRFELILNATTAESLGITLPRDLMRQATRVVR